MLGLQPIASAPLSDDGVNYVFGDAAASCVSGVSANANITVEPSATIVGQTAIGTFGVRIQFVQSLVETSSATVANVIRVRISDSTVNAQSSINNPTPIVTAGGSGVVEASSALTSRADRFRTSSALSEPAASLSSSAIRYRTSDGTVSASVTPIASAIRVATSSALIEPTSLTLSSANITASGSGIVTATSDTDIIGQITAQGVAQLVQTTSGVAAAGREKWEPIAAGTETWTQIPETSNTWTKVA